MEIYNQIQPLKNHLAKIKTENKRIGFVPTMGALHKGHITLINKSVAETDITVASIFVNPNQFNNISDLNKYPRTLDADLQMLREAGCSIVFVPEVSEMYPVPDTRTFQFGILDEVMEGKFRPGHFNGVAQIVSKLFDIVEPDYAYFGEKDFQQLAVIKKMVTDYMPYLKTTIIGCPIVRESDGLAMSSRNMRLNPEQRNRAGFISEILLKAKEMAKNNSVVQVKEFVITSITTDAHFSLEYFEIVNTETFLPVDKFTFNRNIIACIAVIIGDIRLIDNITF